MEVEEKLLLEIKHFIVNLDTLRKNLSFINLFKRDENKLSRLCRLKGNTIANIICMRLAKP